MKTKEEIEKVIKGFRLEKASACKTTKTKLNFAIELLNWVLM